MRDTDNIQPVIIGTDLNAYGVARAFHAEYGINSKIFGRKKLLMVDHSKICDVTEVDDFSDDKVMVDTLINYSKNNSSKKLILFAASEQYVFRILNNYTALQEYYYIPYSSPALGIELSNKMNFYDYCEKYDLDYPKAEVVNKETYHDIQFEINYPVILKPTESNDYFALDFEGKEKAFIIENSDTLLETLNKIYATNYSHDMIIQEYIPGEVSNEYVMNTYSDSSGKVKLMSLGRIIIEDPQPDMRGNYIAIVSPEESETVDKLYEKVKALLENIEFKGLANFDFKFDPRDGKFKTFEINMRQGRSSFFSVLAGANFAIPVVNDVLNDNNQDTELLKGNREFVWINCDKETFYKIIKKQDTTIYEKIKTIDNIDNTLSYNNDKNLFRKHKIKKYFDLYDKRLERYI